VEQRFHSLKHKIRNSRFSSLKNGPAACTRSKSAPHRMGDYLGNGRIVAWGGCQVGNLESAGDRSSKTGCTNKGWRV